MCIFMLFYIIFGTNLLTGGPPQNCCFFAYFRVSQKKNIKRSPNRMKPSGTWFSEQTRSRGLGVYVKQSTRKARGRGRAHLPEARPPPSWAPRCSTDVLLPAKTLFPLPQPSVSVRSHLGAFFGAPPEVALITEGFYINTIDSPMMCE